VTRQSSLEVRSGEHPVDFIGALSIGSFRSMLAGLVDFAGRLLSRLLGRLLVGFDLSVGLDRVDMAISPFLKVRCSADDLYVSIVHCHRSSVAV